MCQTNLRFLEDISDSRKNLSSVRSIASHFDRKSYSLQNEHANARHLHGRNRRFDMYLHKICTPSAQTDLRAKRLQAHASQNLMIQ